MGIITSILIFILFIIVSFIVCLILSFVIWLLYYKVIKKLEFPKNISNYKPISLFKRLFIYFPRQFWLDMFNRVPGEFMEYGLHLVCGEQGSGKTTAVVDLLLSRWTKKYPFLKVYTNMDYKQEDGSLGHWEDLMDVGRDNGVYGTVNVIDEIQGWFSSLQSKDFPPEMLREISQQRKQKKVILGTAQVFGRVAKPIREQTSFVYLPFTIAGCLTVVRVSKPIYYDEETFTFKRYIGMYFFVHTPEIRKSFDTYKKIEEYRKSGFKKDSDRLEDN